MTDFDVGMRSAFFSLGHSGFLGLDNFKWTSFWEGYWFPDCVVRFVGGRRILAWGELSIMVMGLGKSSLNCC